MLRASELASMRATVNSTFPDKCDILGEVGTVSDLGNPVNTWSVVSTAVPCRVTPQTGTSERTFGQQITSTAEASIILPATLQIDASKRIRVYASNATYEVIYCHQVGAEDLSRMIDAKLIG